MKKILLFLFTVLFVIGCDSRAGTDLGLWGVDVPDVRVPDALSDTNQRETINIADTKAVKCPVSDSVFGNIFSIDPAGPLIQIHAAAAWDGTGIWVVYNRPDKPKKGGFDVWAVRLKCDGTHLIEPFMVNHDSMDNNTDPCLAVNGDTVMFAWQTDNGKAPDNMSIWYRSFKIDGTPIMKSDKMLSGGPEDGYNTWMAGVAPLPDSRFVLSGSTGAKGFKGFQALVQKVDKTGKNIGSGFLASPEKGVSQVFPSVASDLKQNIYIAWQREKYDSATDQTSYGVRIARVAINPASAVPTVVFDPYKDHMNQAPACALPATGGPVWMAFQTSGNAATHIMIRNGEDFSLPSVLVQNSAGMNHTPTVVSVPGGGAIVWYTQISGIKNNVMFQEFTENTERNPEMSGSSVKLNTNPVAPYAPAIAALPNGYFVAWSEGKSPDFRINGVFVRKSL